METLHELQQLLTINLDEANESLLYAPLPGSTMLHTAVAHNDFIEVERALASGESLNVLDSEGDTPLYLAIYTRNREMFNHLIALGADVNHQNNSGQTPLHASVIIHDEHFVQPLLIAGADANKQNEDGDTPLHLANVIGNQVIQTLLLNAGANEAILNKSGETAQFITQKPKVIELQELWEIMTDFDEETVGISGSKLTLLQAVEENNQQQVAQFLQTEIDINMINQDGDTPVSYTHLRAHET